MKNRTIQQLLKIQFEHKQRIHQHEDALNEEYFIIDILEVILTDLGFPLDNAHKLPEGHPDAFCRDELYHRFDDDILEGSDQEIQDYVTFLRDYRQEYQEYRDSLKQKG